MKQVTIYTDGGAALRACRRNAPSVSRLAPEPAGDGMHAPPDGGIL